MVLRRAKRTPLFPLSRAASSRDVNFSVFMNIYINLHFTAASVATKAGRESELNIEAGEKKVCARARRRRRRKSEVYSRDEDDAG